MINDQIQYYEELLELGKPKAELYKRLVIYYRHKRLYDREMAAINKILEIYPAHRLVTPFYQKRRDKVQLLKDKLGNRRMQRTGFSLDHASAYSRV